MDDPYLTGTCRWWHLAAPSPELLAAEAAGAVGPGAAAGEAGQPGVAVDLGCGLGTEIAYLADRGWRGLGVDLSAAALFQASDRHQGAAFARADVTGLPLRAGSADLLLDRGCFHYLGPSGRARYAAEARRVLRAGGRLLLRMCLNSAGRPKRARRRDHPRGLQRLDRPFDRPGGTSQRYPDDARGHRDAHPSVAAIILSVVLSNG